MQKQIQCEYCGAILPSSAAVCPHCGAPVEESFKETPTSDISPLDKDLALFLSQYADKFPQEKQSYLKERLRNVDIDALRNEVSKIKLLNPSSMRNISFLLGYLGVDRFLLRQYWLGAAKLLIFLVPLGINIFSEAIIYEFELLYSEFDNLYTTICGIFYPICLIWWLYDVFSSMERVKKFNFNALMRILQ